MPGRWVSPVDPNCPVVMEYYSTLLDDPMTHAYGAPVDDILEDFGRKHMLKCKRCQEYGMENIYVDY